MCRDKYGPKVKSLTVEKIHLLVKTSTKSRMTKCIIIMERKANMELIFFQRQKEKSIINFELLVIVNLIQSPFLIAKKRSSTKFEKHTIY